MESENRIGDRIHRIRETQELTIEELANRTGNTVEFVERLEAGTLAPALASLIKIARALGVRLGTFLDDEECAAPFVTRSGESAHGVHFAHSGAPADLSNLELLSLGAGKQDRHMEPFLVHVAPVQGEVADLSSHEGEEFIYVLEGEIEIAYGKDRHRLGPGDSAYYDSVIQHHLHALGDGTARILAVVFAPI